MPALRAGLVDEPLAEPCDAGPDWEGRLFITVTSPMPILGRRANSIASSRRSVQVCEQADASTRTGLRPGFPAPGSREPACGTRTPEVAQAQWLALSPERISFPRRRSTNLRPESFDTRFDLDPRGRHSTGSGAPLAALPTGRVQFPRPLGRLHPGPGSRRPPARGSQPY